MKNVYYKTNGTISLLGLNKNEKQSLNDQRQYLLSKGLLKPDEYIIPVWDYDSKEVIFLDENGLIGNGERINMKPINS